MDEPNERQRLLELLEQIRQPDSAQPPEVREENLNRMVRASMPDAEITSELRARVKARIAEQQVRRTPLLARIAARIRSQPRWRFALAGAMPAAIAATLLFLYAESQAPVHALQDVIDAMTRARVWKTCSVVWASQHGRLVRRQWVRLPYCMREEIWRDGVLDRLTIQSTGEFWVYRRETNRAVHARSRVVATEMVQGLSAGAYGGPLNTLKQIQPEVQRHGGLAVRERRARGADGKLERILDLEIDVTKHFRGTPEYAGLKSLRHTIVLDAETGRLRRGQYPQQGESFEVTGYDRPLPDTLFTWEPPAGVRRIEYEDWWDRRHQRLATASNDGWRVTLHAIDVGANGDVWLTVTARQRSGSPEVCTWGTDAGVVSDERGRIYVQFHTQMPNFSPGAPASGTLP